MDSIDKLMDKAILLYGNAYRLSEESCVVKGNDGMYSIYGLVNGRAEKLRTSREFSILSPDYNEFSDGGFHKGTRVCDNMGNTVCNNMAYTSIVSVKGNLLVAYGKFYYDGVSVYDIITGEPFKEKEISNTYSYIRMYDHMDYIIAFKKSFNIVDIYDMNLERVDVGRYRSIIVTDKILICSLESIVYDIYDIKLNKIACYKDKVNFKINKDATMDVRIELSSGENKMFTGLRKSKPIGKKKVG